MQGPVSPPRSRSCEADPAPALGSRAPGASPPSTQHTWALGKQGVAILAEVTV